MMTVALSLKVAAFEASGSEISPMFIEGNLQSTYNVVAGESGSVTLTSSVTKGYETFVYGGKEQNQVTINSKGVTSVIGRKYTQTGVLEASYTILVRVPFLDPKISATVGGAAYDTDDTIKISSSKSIVITVSQLIYPESCMIQFDESKCRFDESNRSYGDTSVIIRGTLSATTSTGSGSLKLTARELVGTREGSKSFSIKTNSSDSSSGDEDDDDEDEDDELEDPEKTTIKLSFDRKDVKPGEIVTVFLETTPSMSRFKFDKNDFKYKVNTKGLKWTISEFESYDDPYKAALMIQMPDDPAQLFVYVKLEWDGDEIDSKVLRLNVKEETGAGGGTGSSGSSTGVSGPTVDSTGKPIIDYSGEQIIVKMPASNSVVPELEKLVVGEELTYNTLVFDKLGKIAMTEFSKMPGKKISFVDNNSGSKVTLEAGKMGSLDGRSFYSFWIDKNGDKRASIEKVLRDAGYTKSVDFYQFGLENSGLSATASLYSFIRDGKKAYIYQYDGITLQKIGEQIVQNDGIVLELTSLAPVVLLEEELEKKDAIGVGETAEPRPTEKEPTATSQPESQPADKAGGETSDLPYEDDLQLEIVDLESSNKESTLTPKVKHDVKYAGLIVGVAIIISLGVATMLFITRKPDKVKKAEERWNKVAHKVGRLKYRLTPEKFKDKQKEYEQYRVFK